MTVWIGDRPMGTGHTCVLVAEIGINHNGDMALAKLMIGEAAAAGADAVKFQNYRTDDFVTDRSQTYTYESQGKRITETQYEMFKRCELSRDQLAELKQYADSRGVSFHSTPTNEQGVEDLLTLGVQVLKNGSDYLGNLPLIRAMSKTGLPTVLSTGMATLAEIDEAVRAFRQAGGRNLILLHCSSSYPTPAGEVNLRKIPALAAAFDCEVGFSDHTWGTVTAVGAVALGASWIEKHFTLDRNLPGPDQRFSSDPTEFRELVEAVRTIEKNLGTSAIGPTAGEAASRRDFRLSCVAATAMEAGHVLTEGDIAYGRPGTGVPPAAAVWIVGRTLARPVAPGQILSLELLA